MTCLDIIRKMNSFKINTSDDPILPASIKVNYPELLLTEIEKRNIKEILIDKNQREVLNIFQKKYQMHDDSIILITENHNINYIHCYHATSKK